MKDKNIAGILALFFGWMGIHRFYLGQVGLGILYAVFFWISWVFAIVDAIAFLSMDTDEFNIKYNKKYYRAERRNRDQKKNASNRRREYRYDREERQKERLRKQREQRQSTAPQRPKHNPYKSAGITKFREFDYGGAIKDFEKALEISPDDVAVHFNLACAYSLTENAEKSFYHLDQAVANGFNDFDRIQNHDALAYIRVHANFDQFKQNGYRLVPQLEAPKQNLLDETPEQEEDDLLQQLKKLGELRDVGLLTNEEFEKQKQKLLRRGGRKE